MTKEQIQDPNTDMMLIYHYFFELKGGVSLSFEKFNYCFSIWISNFLGFPRLPQLQYYVLLELENYFNLKD